MFGAASATSASEIRPQFRGRLVKGSIVALDTLLLDPTLREEAPIPLASAPAPRSRPNLAPGCPTPGNLASLGLGYRVRSLPGMGGARQEAGLGWSRDGPRPRGALGGSRRGRRRGVVGVRAPPATWSVRPSPRQPFWFPWSAARPGPQSSSQTGQQSRGFPAPQNRGLFSGGHAHWTRTLELPGLERGRRKGGAFSGPVPHPKCFHSCLGRLLEDLGLGPIERRWSPAPARVPRFLPLCSAPAWSRH